MRIQDEKKKNLDESGFHLQSTTSTESNLVRDGLRCCVDGAANVFNDDLGVA